VYDLIVLLTAGATIASAVRYAWLSWREDSDIDPAPATWILMLVMVGLSFTMYMSSDKRSWSANIGITSGMASVSIILFAVITKNVRDHTLRVTFDRTQSGCILSGLIIVPVWVGTDNHLLSYTLVQCIALVAYYATIKKLRSAETISEPYFFWIIAVATSIAAIYPGWIKRDPYAAIYLGRAIPSTAYILYLIWKIKKEAPKTEI